VLYRDFANIAKNIFKSDLSFSVCRSRNLPVLYQDFWKNAKNNLYTGPSFFVGARESICLPVLLLDFGNILLKISSILTLLSLCAGEEIYLCSTCIFGKMQKVSSKLTLERNSTCALPGVL
jgi:hypothetical protein